MQSDGQRILTALGNEIRKKRKERSFTQQELADRSGLHRTYIADIERGSRNVSLHNICRIATALEISGAELISNIDTRLAPEE